MKPRLLCLCISKFDYESVWYTSVRLTLVTSLFDVASYVWFWLQICLIYPRMSDFDYDLFDILLYVWPWLWICLIWRRSMNLFAMLLHFRIWIRFVRYTFVRPTLTTNLSGKILYVWLRSRICLVYFHTSDSDYGPIWYSSAHLIRIVGLSDMLLYVWPRFWICLR